MLMKSCINSIIFVIILASIPILIYSIKSKKNIFKNILIIDIMYIIYLFIGVFYLPNVLVLDKGLEVLFIYLISFIAGIIYLISIIICKKKIKKNNDKITKSDKISFITIILIILPILLFSCSFLREYYLIKNSELIIESDYQNGIITSENYRYAISENYCKEVTINIPQNLNDKKIEHYIYYINFIDNSDNYEIEKNYIDEDLKYLDKTVAEKILLDAKHNHNNLENYSNPILNKDEIVINSASITYFKDTDYYFVEIGYNHDDVTSIVNAMIYKGENFIGELNISGSIKSATYIEK